MRICMILSTPIPPQEGIGFYVWNLSRQLKRQGHDVVIVTRGGSNEKAEEEIDGIPVLRPAFFPIYPFHVNMHGRFVDQLLHKLGDDIDLVHLHTPLVKVPKVAKPVVVTVHTPMKSDTKAVAVDSLIGLLVKLQAPFSFKIEQALFNRANALTAVAHSVANEMTDYNINPADVTVLGNGVDTSLFFPTAASQDKRLTTPNPYALTVARLASRKGLSDLIECANIVVKKQPSFRFLIAGTGPMEEKLRGQIKRYKLEKNIVLLGHIENRTRLIELYRNATMFIHPAHYEGLPTVLLEAMACGCPVVATAVSGALDVVHHRQNGLLVAPKIPSEIAAGVLELLDNPIQAEKLGQAAKETIEDRYAWQIITQGYIKEYEKFITVQKMLVGITTLDRIQVSA